MKNSLGQSKSVVVNKKTSNSAEKEIISNQLIKDMRDTAMKTVHKNRIYKGNTFTHTST